MSAARACARVVGHCLQKLVLQSRILRALCEHPEFEFDFAGIDADTIRAQACTVDELIRELAPNLDHLLDEPAPGDIVRIDGQRMRIVAGGMLEPCGNDADEVTRRSPSDP